MLHNPVDCNPTSLREARSDPEGPSRRHQVTKYNTIAMNRAALLITTLLAVLSVGGSSAHAGASAPISQADLKVWVLEAMADMQTKEHGSDAVSWADTFDTTAQKIAEAATLNPLLNDPLHTAATMVVIGWHESRYRPDIVGDHGASFGMFQVATGTAKDVGCSKEDLLNPETSSVCALKLLHVSFDVCHYRPIEERLAQYAWGRDCDHRLELSRHRMHQVAKIVKKLPLKHVPIEDMPVEEEVQTEPVMMTGDMVPGDVQP
jgi:hypothetical protein